MKQKKSSPARWGKASRVRYLRSYEVTIPKYDLLNNPCFPPVDLKCHFYHVFPRASLVVLWISIHLTMQSPVFEDSWIVACQTSILEWVAISFSRGSSHPGIEPGCPALQADSLPTELPGKPRFNPLS